jgi:hypothetical protein
VCVCIGGADGDADADADAAECEVVADCDDGIPCTWDCYNVAGICDHVRASPSCCLSDDECPDDRWWCSGREVCNAGECGHADQPVCDDGNPCTYDQCGLLWWPDLTWFDVCDFQIGDADGDRYPDHAPSGAPASCVTDCGPDDPNIHPGAREVCDDGADNNCDTLTDGEDPGCG